MKKKIIGGIALLTVTLTFVFAMNLKAQDTDDTDTSFMKDDVEQICCKEEFTNMVCYIYKGKQYRGKHVPC